MKRPFLFFGLLFQTLFAFSQIGLPIKQSLLPKNSLVVDYDFTKSSSYTRGATTVTNIASTASGSATLINSPAFFNSLGILSFNGSNQYVVTPNLRPHFKSVNASVQESFTMTMWVYPTQLNGVIVTELNSQTPNSGWHASNIEIVNGFINYRIWSGTTIVSMSAVNLNQWYHIAMVYDGSKLKAYLNGVLQGTQINDREIPTTAQHYAIAATESTQMGSGGGYGTFHLAQYKLYHLPFTDTDIAQEYDIRKAEFDYTIHSPSTNSNPTYWSISSAWNNSTGGNGASDPFGTNHFTPWLNSSLGWAAQVLDANQYITLNYQEPAYIKGIVTQPRASSGNQWIKTAHIETSMNGSSFTRLLTSVAVNSSIVDDNYIKFTNPVFAKYVKLIPTDWNNHIVTRMGLLVKPNNFTGSNLVVYYNPSMTESYPGTGTNLLDLSGNGLNGTMSNLTYSNPAFSFNGTTSQVSIPDNALLEPGTGSWTMEVWFNNTGSSGTVLGKYNAGGAGANISYALRLQGSNVIRADYSNGTNYQITDNYTFASNNWVQMVYVWDKTNNNIYTYSNGTLKQTKAITLTGGLLNATTNLYLGSYNGGEFSQYFSGKMGIVRIYKTALSASEILKNYDASKALYGVIQNGLVMNLTSPPSSGTTWTDASGNGNNATLVNTPTYTASNGGGYTTASTSYIATNYNLPNTFTISMAASFNPTTYWATLWGNEIWDTQKGYIAYFINNAKIELGSPSGAISSVAVDNINAIHIWDFVVNETNYVLYKDGVSIGTGTFTAPTGGASTTGLYFGARHTNPGSSYADIGPGTYYSMRVYNRALAADEVKTNFSFLKSVYGL